MSDKAQVKIEAEELATLHELVDRATAAGMKHELVLYDEPEREVPGFVRLEFPNGRGVRPVVGSVVRAGRLLGTTFEHFIFLGDYEAFIDTSTGNIEAQISGLAGGVSSRTALWTLPGVEVFEEPSTGEEDGSDDADPISPLTYRPERWRLLIKDGIRSIEISPMSGDGAAIWLPRRQITMKLSGFPTKTHDEALDVLERFGNALLFEIDVLYGLSAAIQRRRNPTRRRKEERADQPPTFPKNNYATEPLALYQYARTATGLPLLEYLAYYQSLEFFFPIFAREHTVKSLRTALLSPKFNPTDDAAVNKLINLAAPAVRAGLGEREQLRSTVRACVEIDDLKELIESSEEFTEHFCSRKQAIRGVVPIRLGDQSDLRDQVADRIYAIRCRVVHTKQDSGGPGDEILLPSSSETESLRADIELVRFVAQRALFARAART